MKKLIVKIKAAYHYFFHTWDKTGWNQVNVGAKRKCKYCGKEQILVAIDYGTDFDPVVYVWEDVKPKEK